MLPIKKFYLGLQPEIRAFRIDSLIGMIIDTILDARGSDIPNSFYSQIIESSNPVSATLFNIDKSNLIFISKENITFTKSLYPDKEVNTDQSISEFEKVWNLIQSKVNLKKIRKIGFAAEHRITPDNNPNIQLLMNLTKIENKKNYPSKFNLHFESRSEDIEKLGVDGNSLSFQNIIYDFYDSSLDADSPEPNKFNINFDYQNYYTPAINDKVFPAIRRNFVEFKKELLGFNNELKNLGLIKWIGGIQIHGKELMIKVA